MASPHVKHVTDATFDAEVLGRKGVTLVDFHALWCAPCKAMNPTLDALAEEHAGRLQVAKLDVDLNQDVVTRYGVRGMPTFLIFKDGAVAGQIVGAVPRRVLEERLAQVLG